MEKIVLVVHMLAALAIIGLILMQQGKGASAGASFGGGASQTVFGSEGSGNFFTRATSLFALIFFCTSFGLAILAKNSVSVSDSAIPTAIESIPADVAIPSIDVNALDVPSAISGVPAGSDMPGVSINAADDIPEVPVSTEE